MDCDKLKTLSINLFQMGAIKFGAFKLKSGIVSPIYFDFRAIISHPKIMTQLSDLIWEKSQDLNLEFDVLCGVPYTALPIATLVSAHHNIPMLMRRKESKSYGTAKLVEGDYKAGTTRCLIIEDVVTTGSSVVETSDLLRQHGILVTDCVVMLDRSGGGGALNLENKGIKMISLLDVTQLLTVLLQEGCITNAEFVNAEKFMSSSLASASSPPLPSPPTRSSKMAEQLQPKTEEQLEEILTKNLIPRLTCPVSQKLVRIMFKKRSNLCLSADVEDWTQLIEVVNELGPHICLLKTHVDMLNFQNFDEIIQFKKSVKELANKFEFLVLEDRKFADIGSTVHRQLTAKPFEISGWSDMVTIHGIPGPGIFQSFEEIQKVKDFGVVVIAEMSSAGNIPAKLTGYKEECFKISKGFEQMLAGFVSQSKVSMTNFDDTKNSSHPFFLQFTPGVSLAPDTKGDGMGQQYCSVEEAILDRGADVIIVGRGILKQSKNTRIEVTQKFQRQGWNAFVQKLS